MRWFVGCLMGGIILIAGCVDEPAPAPVSQGAPRTRTLPKAPEPPPPPTRGPEPPYPRGGTLQLNTDPLGGPAYVADTTQVKAEAGVGVHGSRLEDPRLVQTIVTPALAFFRVQERIQFEAQVPHALQLFEAEHGRKPKTHEEFMEKIIQANRINLPELPPGHRYLYDPQAGELMVEKPQG